MPRWPRLLLLPFFAGAAAAQAQAVSTELSRRAEELVPVLNGGGDLEATFATEFLRDVPEARLREVAASVRDQLGTAKTVRGIEPVGPRRAELIIAYEKGTARADLTLAADGQVIGFVIGGLQPARIAALRSLDEIAATFAALPGATGFAVAEVAPAGEALVALEPDRPLGVASTFKLVILAELVRQIDADERKWSDTLTLGRQQLPAGDFTLLPAGTRVTLRQLAEAMIRVSDNSASDLLLFTLGRARVEGIMAPLGFSYADLNVPPLSTLELFKLKGIEGGALGRRYLAADPQQRRRLLAEDVARAPGSAIDRRYALGRPVMVESIEWFATPMDLVRAMGWFARHAHTPGGRDALRILSLNPGPGQGLQHRFAYLGYKGGSEPGVASITVLIRDKVARWKVVTATWNNPAEAIDEAKFEALVTRALEIVDQ